jgi:uncharacterized protein
MRFRFPAALFLACLLLLSTGGPAAWAQYGGGYLPGRGPSAYGVPAYQERGSRYGGQRYAPPPPGYRVQPQYGGRFQPAPPSGGFFFPWFNPAPQPAYQPDPAYRQRQRAVPREVRRPVPRAPTPEQTKQAQVEPSIFVGTFGDSLADLVANGLDEVFEDNLDLEIVSKTRGDTGLARMDHHDWPKAIQEVLNSNQKITYAVVMLGSNDRQIIREGETSHDPLTDRWREIYRERVDAVLKPFVERRIPLLWVGLPPVRNERVSKDFMALNDIYRDRVQKAGAVYVDIWEAFSHESRYSPVGPDVDGQVTRLRAADGVHFTRPGARKAAHFAGVELKRLIEAGGPGANIAAAPAAPGADASSVEKMINAAVPGLPEPAALRLPAPRPAAGPVVPLNRVDVSPGGTLVSTRPRLDPDTAHVVERTLRDGVPPPPKPGRADDFSWPK